MSKLWAARTKDGMIQIFYKHKPIRERTRWEPSVGRFIAAIIDDPNLFPEVTWENSPKELTIKE